MGDRRRRCRRRRRARFLQSRPATPQQLRELAAAAPSPLLASAGEQAAFLPHRTEALRFPALHYPTASCTLIFLVHSKSKGRSLAVSIVSRNLENAEE